MKSLIRQFRRPTLLCFSPPVMIATMVIELGLAAWIISRYAISHVRQLIIAILICLAAFQLAEFNVCGSAMPGLTWSRLGYVFITFLPPLGIHLISRIRRENHPTLIRFSYAAAGLFAATFALLPAGLNQGVCSGNYVIFRLAEPLSTVYTFSYIALVLFGLTLALRPLARATPNQRLTLQWIAAGYLAFTLPTFIINYLLPATHKAIPSIMCGFAVILAIILGLRVAPLALEPNTTNQAS
ncbi:MAG: rane protein of unknown function [Patescibacteria group bacterium]|nr:rane protein of unknown function [Patescibacteria group bacterium]